MNGVPSAPANAGWLEWFADPDFRGCLFVKAASEFQEPNHPVHLQAAAHKAQLLDRLRNLAAAAGARDPDCLARQLLIIKEGTIVAAQVERCDEAAAQGKAAATTLLDRALAH